MVDTPNKATAVIMFSWRCTSRRTVNYHQEAHEGYGRQCIIQASQVLQVPTRTESCYGVCIFQNWTQWRNHPRSWEGNKQPQEGQLKIKKGKLSSKNWEMPCCITTNDTSSSIICIKQLIWADWFLPGILKSIVTGRLKTKRQTWKDTYFLHINTLKLDLTALSKV